MKTFENSASDEVFSFLEGFILEADKLLGSQTYMLIGSYARDIHLLRAGRQSPRGTQDLDLSLAAQNSQAFRKSLDSFGPSKGLITRRSWAGVPVDLIPFGPIANQGIWVDGDSRWEVRGLEEAYRTAELYPIRKAQVKIPCLEAMLGLKIIAWGERDSPRDCDDFYHLLDAHVWGPGLKQVWGILDENENELMERYDANLNLLAAYEAGRKLAEIFRGEALDRCQEILAEETEQEKFIGLALGNRWDHQPEAEGICRAFMDGLAQI